MGLAGAYCSVSTVPDVCRRRINVGAYEQPCSGVGITHDPLGAPPDCTGLTLHESGFLPENRDWNFPSVYSPFWRLYYDFARGHSVCCNDHTVRLGPGHLVLIPPQCLFHCRGPGAVPSLWLHFGFAREPHPDLRPPFLLPLRPLDRRLIGELRERIVAAGNSTPTHAVLHHSLALLHVSLARPELRWHPPVSPSLERVRKHIRQHLDRPLDNRLLASLAGMGLTRFIRAFHDTFGMTPARHVTELRVQQVTRMLLHSEMSLDEIAERTGFPNRSYLSRVFRNLRKDSPAAFRRRYRG